MSHKLMVRSERVIKPETLDRLHSARWSWSSLHPSEAEASPLTKTSAPLCA